eukprot:3654261-Alexandrium_andersonii.AAC.1
MTPDEQNAIGDWQEVPKGQAPSGARGSLPMRLRYAGDKVSSAGEVKVRTLAALGTAGEAHLGRGRRASGLLPPGAFGWQELRER